MRFKCYAAIMSADSLHVERADDQDDRRTGRGNASEASYPWLVELPATDRAYFSRLHRACSIARKHRPFSQRYGTSNRRRRWVSTSTGSKPSWTFPKPCDESCSPITFMGSTDALLRGWCPPNLTFFARREVYARLGGFDLSFKIGADIELMARYLEVGRISNHYIPKVLVHMRMGGTTNRSSSNIVKQNLEIRRGFLALGLEFSWWRFMGNKVVSRALQFVRRPAL